MFVAVSFFWGIDYGIHSMILCRFSRGRVDEYGAILNEVHGIDFTLPHAPPGLELKDRWSTVFGAVFRATGPKSFFQNSILKLEGLDFRVGSYTGSYGHYISASDWEEYERKALEELLDALKNRR